MPIGDILKPKTREEIFEILKKLGLNPCIIQKMKNDNKSFLVFQEAFERMNGSKRRKIILINELFEVVRSHNGNLE